MLWQARFTCITCTCNAATIRVCVCSCLTQFLLPIFTPVLALSSDLLLLPYLPSGACPLLILVSLGSSHDFTAPPHRARGGRLGSASAFRSETGGQAPSAPRSRRSPVSQVVAA